MFGLTFRHFENGRNVELSLVRVTLHCLLLATHCPVLS